jgi:hypothetical protein
MLFGGVINVPLMVAGASSIMMMGGAEYLKSEAEPLRALNSNPSTSIFITKNRLQTEFGHGFHANCLLARMESTAATRTLWIFAPCETALDRAASVSAWPLPLFVLKYNS